MVIPLAGSVPCEQASIAGVPKRVFVTNSVRYCVGLNAGLVVNESSAAAINSLDSSDPSAALILCSVYFAIASIFINWHCRAFIKSRHLSSSVQILIQAQQLIGIFDTWPPSSSIYHIGRSELCHLLWQLRDLLDK